MSIAPRRKRIPDSVKLCVALLALGKKPSEIDWSHEPALGLRAINEAGTDYDPPQLDPRYLFIRDRAEHDHLTFEDNGTGRGDLTAIAHVKRTVRKQAEHQARVAAKVTGEEPPPRRRKQAIRSGGFDKGHRPMRSRNTFQQRRT